VGEGQKNPLPWGEGGAKRRVRGKITLALGEGGAKRRVRGTITLALGRGWREAPGEGL
jgi:hypothetical protein